MIPFKNYGPLDRVERKALLVAGLFCFGFIGLLSIVHRPATTLRRPPHNVTVPAPVTPTKLLEPEVPPPPTRDFNAPYRIVPANFKRVDFNNLSYGLYAYPNAKRAIDVTLTDGEFELPKNSGWFALEDVFYKDLTGDGKPEAIVRLSHVECGVSCDGGADVFYIYTRPNGKLRQLWQYETGTYAYGCGLKSMTISYRQIVLELFGRCPKPQMENSGAGKFLAKDMTFLLFPFNGTRFVRPTIEYFETSTIDVRNYEASIYIF